jgi:hypothetical protein
MRKSALQMGRKMRAFFHDFFTFFSLLFSFFFMVFHFFHTLHVELFPENTRVLCDCARNPHDPPLIFISTRKFFPAQLI